LDSANKLRCHHGPEPPRSYVSGDCTLSSLVQILPNDSYVILDIKTDFIATATIVLDEISNSHVRSYASKIVFQLYQPSHVRWFERAWRMYPGLIKNQPIVTLYRTRSRAPFVAKVLPRYVAALTFPIDRDDLIGLESKIFGLNIKPYYVHPAKTCWEYYQSRLRGVHGVYGPSTLLSCPSLPWAVDPFSEPIKSP